ncbi:MAG TPA: 2Fe-2S iron-sulfur cluster-binding protein [Bacteroidales bacterium]|nr:2Fe-2S iron-sulfur cluster-binding protein [Bacteroidales bacterium]
MIKLRINQQELEVQDDITVLEAALAAGFEIPTMCNNGEVEHFASCMVCLVKDLKNGSFLPSCSTRVLEGMNLVTDDKELTEARKTALDLLLSEHVGDCEAPCRVACPAFMDIPEMNRLIAAGRFEEAYSIVSNDIALPGILGRICPAPCESICRRKSIDSAVSICLLKRFTADSTVHALVKPTVTFKQKVCIIGSGPAGLSAAFYLQLKGIQTSLFDSNLLPGGALRYVLSDDRLDQETLDLEIERIRSIGVQFEMNQHIDTMRFKRLCSEFDAVVLATGNFGAEMNDWGLDHDGKHLLVDKTTHRTNLPTVFAIGNTTRSSKLAIRSAAQGKEVAVSIEQFFLNEPVTGEARIFNSSFGKLLPSEGLEYLKESTNRERQSKGVHSMEGFSREAAKLEAERCLHCDCRKADRCILRNLSDRYNASQKRFAHHERLPLIKKIAHENLIYEPNKCIKCGICVRLTAKHQETFGFTFIGRGFQVEVGAPFDEHLESALVKTMEIVSDACPTGALSRYKTTKE